MKMLTDWNCHLLPMMGEWIAAPKDAREAMLCLHARTGIRRFCMMAEFDCRKESLPCFLLERDRAMRELREVLPDGVRLLAGGYLRLRPELTELAGLERLCIPKYGLLPVQLPWTAPHQELVSTWNHLLYHVHARILLMDTEHYVTAYPPDTIERILRLDNVVYQFGYLSLGDPQLRRIIRRLYQRGATVLFGTGVNSPGAAAYYDFLSAKEAALAAFDRPLLEAILTMDPRETDNKT